MIIKLKVAPLLLSLACPDFGLPLLLLLNLVALIQSDFLLSQSQIIECIQCLLQVPYMKIRRVSIIHILFQPLNHELVILNISEALFYVRMPVCSPSKKIDQLSTANI